MSIQENMSALLDAAAAEAEHHIAYPYKIVFTPTGAREVTFVVTMGEQEISHFSISILPGCKRVVVFHGVTVEPTYRNQGLGKTLHGYRLAVAERFGAKTAMCTVLVGNSVEKKILAGYGWSCMAGVTPGIEIWTKVIRKDT